MKFIRTENQFEIIFEQKFIEKHIDEFVNAITNNIKNSPNDKYYFNFIETNWISNQELLVFTALIYHFLKNNTEFTIDFYKKGTFPNNEKDKRKAYFLINLWDNWRIHKILADEAHLKKLRLTHSFIQKLKKVHNINLLRNEIYKSNLINTPFQILPFIKNYSDNQVGKYVNKIIQIEKANVDIIEAENLKHPFLDESLGSIIVKELYENFLDHFDNSFISKNTNFSFLSLSIHGKIKSKRHDAAAINKILEKNFNEENIVESKSFFFNKKLSKYKNNPYLEFSFLDFGEGITTTLKKEFKTQYKGNYDDSDILKFAFKYNSSKSPLYLKHHNLSDIPRGLFDVLSIVKKYKGMLLARSNFGKIIYNFSETEDLEKAFSKINSSNKESFFPGTLISIYLPTFDDYNSFDYSTIKPDIKLRSSLIEDEIFFNLYPILKKVNQLNSKKDELYSLLIKELDQLLLTEKSTITYINFKGCEEFDERLLKKSIFFLITDYRINLQNNIILLNPPSEGFIKNIKDEILSLNTAIKKYIIHPLPLIRMTDVNGLSELSLNWLGVFDENDEKKLNELLFGEFNYSLNSADFNSPDEVIGQMNSFDENKNLLSNLPSKENLIKIINSKRFVTYYKKSNEKLLNHLIEEKKCLKDEGLYLCNGNYYQEKYLQLSNILDDKEDCEFISDLLNQKLKNKCDELQIDINSCVFIGVTSSSHKILDSLKGNYKEENFNYIDNYLWFENGDIINSIKKESNYILICDAISTGYLTDRIETYITDNSSQLILIGVIANTIDSSFEGSKLFLKKNNNKLVSLLDISIKKYRRDKLPTNLKSSLSLITRINPYTNTPIVFSIDNTFNESILLNNEEFLELINNDDINIRFKYFNNLIHPYFFDLKRMIINENEIIRRSNFINSILSKTFSKLETIHSEQFSSKNLKIFYPKKSDITFLDFNLFKTNILKNNGIKDYQLERFNTKDGWKFPHLSDYYKEIIENNDILILDDGSCTGDSLTQMLNEISYFNPNRIYLVCIIGRINDHKRELFSKLSQLSNKISVQIYFSSYWHIPTFYLDNNPYSEEIKYIEDLIDIVNIPNTLKRIAVKVLDQIRPNDVNNKDYKYLIPLKDENKYPKKSIILIREKIGKVVGYRYYKESFNWFNDLVAELEDLDNKKKDRTKNIELVCMCILYEPYLFDEIKKVMPDITDKIEEFVLTFIFGNPKKYYKKFDLKKHLYFDWTENKRNIIHLFFIVFKKKQLITFLEIGELKELMSFANSTRNINYVLYKLTYYFLNYKGLKIDLKIKDLINDLSKSTTYKKVLRNYLTFIRTLPASEDYYSQIKKLKDNYDHINDIEVHRDKISFTDNFSEISFLIDLFEKNIRNSKEINESDRLKIFDYWNINSQFIQSILSFCNSFPEFLSPMPDHNKSILGKKNSLISSMKFIDDFINVKIPKWNSLDKSDLQIREQYLTDIKLITKYRNLIENLIISEDSIFYKSINESETLLKDVVNDLCNEINKIYEKKYSFVTKNNKFCSIPYFYYKKTVLNEIVNNLKNHSEIKCNKIKLFVIEKEKELVILIGNRKSSSMYANSTGNGLKYIKMISDSKLFDFSYSSKESNAFFIQKLKFKYQ